MTTTITTTTTTRHLTCCCCGNSAGRWAQHWNRDAGYGICRKCVEWIARRWPNEDLQHLYGIEGINYAPAD